MPSSPCPFWSLPWLKPQLEKAKAPIDDQHAVDHLSQLAPLHIGTKISQIIQQQTQVAAIHLTNWLRGLCFFQKKKRLKWDLTTKKWDGWFLWEVNITTRTVAFMVRQTSFHWGNINILSTPPLGEKIADFKFSTNLRGKCEVEVVLWLKTGTSCWFFLILLEVEMDENRRTRSANGVSVEKKKTSKRSPSQKLCESLPSPASQRKQTLSKNLTWQWKTLTSRWFLHSKSWCPLVKSDHIPLLSAWFTKKSQGLGIVCYWMHIKIIFGFV